jgi:hypothetical protein
MKFNLKEVNTFNLNPGDLIVVEDTQVFMVIDLDKLGYSVVDLSDGFIPNEHFYVTTGEILTRYFNGVANIRVVPSNNVELREI